jgi:hypothetical protein
MLAYLKIKIVSLAAEATLIRREERKWKARRPSKAALLSNRRTHPDAEEIFFGLKDHRRTVVRDEARWAQLAYAFLRGRPYASVERPVRKVGIDVARVAELAYKYGRRYPGGPTGPQDAKVRITDWLEA